LAHYDRDLFDAIAIEKSGIKGMRLLVAKSLVTQDVSKRFSLDLEYLHLNRFKTLRNCHYGPQVDGTYLDFLWMVTDGEKERREMELLMSTRFRLSAKDPEEFAQAAATQLVFLEADAIIGSMLSRLKSEHARKDRQALHRGGAA